MIDLFAKSCNLDDAMKLFSEVATENVVLWNAIISGCIKNREMWAALGLFSQMVNGFSIPNGFTFSSVLTACTALGEMEMGRGLHGSVIKHGLKDDVFLGTAIVDLYAKCGDVNDAVKQFSRMPSRNVVSWTVIISGFVQKEDYVNALRYFKIMKEIGEVINKYTITSVLTACAKPAMSKEAFQVHGLILKAGFSLDSAVKDALINTYAKIGKIELAAMVFEEFDLVENVRSWAIMISGLGLNNRLRESVELFQEMFREGLKPDKYSCSSILSVINRVDMGQQVHSYIIKASLILEMSVACALSTMYSKCGYIGEAYTIFEQMPEKDGVSWTSIIAGFVEHGQGDKAFELFRKMVFQEDLRVDQTTLAAVLMACSTCISLRKGKEIHGYAIRVELGTEVIVGGALVNMYSKCKKLASARKIFDAMPQKDHIAWSSLVSGYAQYGCNEGAIYLFQQMLVSGMKMDSFTVSSVIVLLGNLTRPAMGKQLHASSVKTGLDLNESVSSSLITMYSKCGNIEDSHKVFDQTRKPDLVTWTTMIACYAQHGQGLEALKIYDRMRKEGTAPDSVTFVGVLSACTHNGLVEEGYIHLNSMVKDFGIEPNSHHYACMVDLLGRAGRLEEAKMFIDSMPIKPDTLVWGAFLAACRVHRNVDLGQLAFEKIIALDPTDEGAHVLLSNIYADLGDWERVIKIRHLMKGHNLNKQPGLSFV
ncbi:pentatricopeptide repeat-containing protein At1g74600, chloroplastic isoform X2 [Aristolochia californica]